MAINSSSPVVDSSGTIAALDPVLRGKLLTDSLEGCLFNGLGGTEKEWRYILTVY